MPNPQYLPTIFYAYIGPRNIAPTDPTLYGHWDWYVDTIDPSNIPPVQWLGPRALEATMQASDTAMSFSVGMPDAAGMWLGPNGAGEGWEYISYYNSGANCLREVQAGQNGVHSVGALGYTWFPLQMNNGSLEFDDELSENMSTSVWTAKLSGVRAPNQVLKPEHLILITYDDGYSMMDDQTTANEYSCRVFLLGFVERVHLQNDQEQNGLWDIDIVCTSRLMDTSQVPSVRVGPTDIAQQASASAASSLGAPWKLTMPQNQLVQTAGLEQIDLVEAQADCDPSHALDGNKDTLWVSDGWVGNPALFLNTKKHKSWMNVFCYPHPTAPYGTKYIEVINYDDINWSEFYVFAKWSIRDAAGAVLQWKTQWYWGCEPNFFVDQGIGINSFDDADDTPEQRLIIAEDLSIFQRQFPAAKALFMLDASTFSGVRDIESARRVWWEGGALFFHWQFDSAHGGSNGTDFLLIWGNTDKTECDAVWQANALAGFSLPSQDFKLDFTNILPGQVFRRNLAADTMVFTNDYIHHPGYVIDHAIDADDSGNGSRRSEWFKIVLPEMNHVLRFDIAPGDTTLYVVDAQGQPNVDGFAKKNVSGGLHSGAVIIDSEIIPFADLDFIQGTLTGCTVTQKHKKAAKIYIQVNTLAFGSPNGAFPNGYKIPQDGKTLAVASNYYPLESLEWGRGFYPSGAARTPFMGNYVIRFSLNPDAPDPTVDSYFNAYLNSPIIDSTGWVVDVLHPSIQQPNVKVTTTDATFDPTGSGFRPACILIQFREMWNFADTPSSISTERPRLNYFSANLNKAYYDENTWLAYDAAGVSPLTVIAQIFQLSGHLQTLWAFDGSSLVYPVAKKGTTDRDTAWRVASDMAEYGSGAIRCDRDGHIGIGVNEYLLGTNHSPHKNYGDADITALEITNVRPSEVGQVRLTWESGIKDVHGTALYPATQRYGGDIVELGPLLAGDQATADLLAQHLYSTKRFAYNIFVELAVTDTTIKCRDIHQITYDFNKDGLLQSKLCLVETINQSISNGRMKTRIGYREIDRTTV